MAKSRQKIQQLGFWDPEVVTLDHDTICLWAYENTDIILKKIFPNEFDRPWSMEDLQYGEICTRASLEAFFNSTPKPNPRAAKRILEDILYMKTGYNNSLRRIIGYADLLFTVQLPFIRFNNKISAFAIGWKSLVKYDRPVSVLVEVKSRLPTIGELLRQISLYRTADHHVDSHVEFCVVASDDKYESILAQQGITFVKFNQGVQIR